MSETKRKIIEVASDLFGSKGYAATSIRDIASGADVNIAAINYHFKNKAGLYCEIFDLSHCELDRELQTRNCNCETAVEFAQQCYDIFMEDQKGLLNIFKILLNDDVPVPEGRFSEGNPSDFGPPGQKLMLEILDKELGKDFPAQAKRWATRVIFSHIVHTAVMMSTSLIKEKCSHMPEMTPEQKKLSLQFLVQAVLEFAKNHPENWKE